MVVRPLIRRHPLHRFHAGGSDYREARRAGGPAAADGNGASSVLQKNSEKARKSTIWAGPARKSPTFFYIVRYSWIVSDLLYISLGHRASLAGDDALRARRSESRVSKPTMRLFLALLPILMYACSHIGCTWSSDDHRALGGHKKSHVVYSDVDVALGGEVLGGAGARQLASLRGKWALWRRGGGGQMEEEEESEEKEESEEELEELEELDGGGSDGEDVDEAGDAGLAALAAKAAAPVQAAADADIEAANAGLRWLSFRQEYGKYQRAQLTKPNATRNAIFSAKVVEMGLSQKSSLEVRRITLDMMSSCEDPHCTCSNHTAKIWGATRRATAEGMLVTADALGAPLFVEKKRTDAKLGKDAMGLELPSILFSLRHYLERTARSVCHAAGSFLYLDGTTQFKDSGGCVELQQTELVLRGAANAHAAWNASAAKPLLCERAAELGYSKVLLVPMGYSACEDATLATTRTSVDVVQWRLSILAPHCMNHDHFVSVGGLLTKPNFSEKVLPPKTTRGPPRRTQRASQMATGWTSCCAGTPRGFLLWTVFPGFRCSHPKASAGCSYSAPTWRGSAATSRAFTSPTL